jgi:hypothetical protein
MMLSRLEYEEVLQMRREVAALRADLQRTTRDYYACKYSPNQPRVPAGSREGGRWTDGGGVSISVDGESTARVRLADASSVLSPAVMSDANPAPIIAVAQYGRTPINFEGSALTSNPVINSTTARLAIILQRVKDAVENTSDLSPQRYGIEVHSAFAAEVKAQGQQLGIAASDVETTFGGNYYGAKGSVRTDVVLRNDVGQVIAIYDVKTGEKGIEPARAAELRIKVGVGNEVPIIQISFKYGLSRKYALSGKALVQAPLNCGG